MTTPAILKTPTDDQKKSIARRSRVRDRSCLPEIRDWFDACPGMTDVNSPVACLIDALMAGHSDLIVEEASRRWLARVQAELEGPDPSPMERLLAERAAICLYEVNRYEWWYTKAQGLSIQQADSFRRRIDSAHRRFLSAVRTLAVVRRLSLPVVRVNINRGRLSLPVVRVNINRVDVAESAGRRGRIEAAGSRSI